jgi:hypothetical protein
MRSAAARDAMMWGGDAKVNGPFPFGGLLHARAVEKLPYLRDVTSIVCTGAV